MQDFIFYIVFPLFMFGGFGFFLYIMGAAGLPAWERKRK